MDGMIPLILDQVAQFGSLALFVLALDAVVLAWLGGWWGVLVGQLFLALYVYGLGVNLPQMAGHDDFYDLWLLQTFMVGVLMVPAWFLGLLLRFREHRRRRWREKAK